MPAFTHANLADVPDAAPAFGLDAAQEAHFASDHVGTTQSGLSYHVFKPGKRQAFGHRHDESEEVYVVLAGTGKMNVGGEVLDVKPLDAIRVEPQVLRAFEAGPDGLQVLAFGPRRTDDRGELVSDWWGE